MNTDQLSKSNWLLILFKKTIPVLPWLVLLILVGLVFHLRKTPLPAQQSGIGMTALPTAAEETANSVRNTTEYDWQHGRKLYLNVSLPEMPAEAKVYVPKTDPPLTAKAAQSLAQQFGIEGEIYKYDIPHQSKYLITDGRQQLYILSQNTWRYESDFEKDTSPETIAVSDIDVPTVIDSFLKSHGFTFEYQIERNHKIANIYRVLPLTPDGYGIHFGGNGFNGLDIVIGKDGQVNRVTSHQAEYATAGTYPMISAEDAFQKLLASRNSTQTGIARTILDSGTWAGRNWYPSYSDHETITLYGYTTRYEPIDAGKLSLTMLGNYPVTGSILPADQLIEASGQFETNDGIRKFNVESWKVTYVQNISVTGTLRREGNQVLLTTERNSEYILTNMPEDIPLDMKPGRFTIHGFPVNGTLHWNWINYDPTGTASNGPGMGDTFYKLNLSGKPVPFPDPSVRNSEYIVRAGDTLHEIAVRTGISYKEIMQANGLVSSKLSVGQPLILPGTQPAFPDIGKRFDHQRGILLTHIYKNSDGSQRVEYRFFTDFQKDGEHLLFNVRLKGSDLQKLEEYHNRPIEITGTLTNTDSENTLTFEVERFSIPFPDLDFQVLRGTETLAKVQGRNVLIFRTDDGTTYVEGGALGMPVNDPALVFEGNSILAEVLVVPNHSFGGYPVVRIFTKSGSNASGESLSIHAKQPYLNYESPNPEIQVHTHLDLSIDNVELVYYGADSYLQPAWRFSGHYSNGIVFIFHVQALKQDYLLPELWVETGGAQ